ncbi:lysophosphatidylcholine acyltransferase 2 isoform X3 [Aplysia californica]|uniref:Lysophosphatidylcholine acyltransferase 2 isoform X3 n=1 Tax=Aplysia californica TaxID=6500 RepID=A0ABM1VXB4_APLCA|nr:lysophosphatidylcholine acyltransferase 2 isoform X3 [Aplysia californica]XP_035827057.1 lysophosphatidylcholine acyltransferase 2 isoform X3 [Aplysia californica]
MKRNQMPRQKSLVGPDIQNPFVHKMHFTFLDKLQVVLMSITIAPIRLILVILLLLMVWPIVTLAVAFRSEEDKTKPLSGWRTFAGRPLVVVGRMMFWLMGFVWVRTTNARAPASEAPLLVVAHHTSFFDILLFFTEFPLASPVSRLENAGVPLIGTLIEFSQPVLVKREDPNSRVNTIKEIQRRGQSGGQWPQIIIFPEGTCTNRTCLISFKQGAFYPGVPVQPVCVKYPNRLDTITWTWEGPGAFTQLWLTLCQFYTRIEIEYLPVYTPSEEEKADPKLFANNVRTLMAESLKCPVTDHTYDDCRLMTTAQKLKLPAHAGLVEFEKLHSKLGVNFDKMQDLLVKFKDIKGAVWRKGSANITFEEFSRYLLLPKSDALQQVFDLYDRDGSGTIDFREYVIGLSLISEPANNDETIQLAFQLFDTENKGHITPEELQHILTGAFNISDTDAERLFEEVDVTGDGKITIDEFKTYAEKKPEYAKVFITYQELKQQQEQQPLGRKECFSSDHSGEFDQWSMQVEQLSSKKLQ